MKPLKDYLIRNFEKSTLEQIADDYREKGYTIKLGNKVGPYRVDLTATKGNETVYIELKTHSEKTEGSEGSRIWWIILKNIRQMRNS